MTSTLKNALNGLAITAALLCAPFTNAQTSELPPPQVLDLLSFNSEAVDEELLSKLSLGSNSFPLIPLGISSFGQTKFLGFKIPATFLGTQPVALKNQIPLVIGGAINHQVQEAMTLLKLLNAQQDQKFAIYFFNGELYALDSKYSVSLNNSSCVGICLDFLSNTIFLGQQFNFLFSFQGGFNSFNLTEQSGLNLADSYSKLFESLNTQLTGENANEALQRINSLQSQLQGLVLAQVEKESSLKRSLNSKNPVIFRQDYKGESPARQFLLKVPQRTELSRELQTAMTELSQNIQEEKKLNESVSKAVAATRIFNNVEMNQFVQGLCDRASQVYQVPEELWPRCFVAGEIAPNAWAYPGGDLFFSVGMFGLVETLDGFLSVVGHEIGHVVARHGSKSRPLFNSLNNFSAFLGLVFNAFQFQSMYKLFQSPHFISATAKTLADAQVGGYAANFTLMTAASGVMAFSRSNEYQADRFGQEVAFAAGATLEGMKDLSAGFQRFSKKMGRDSRSLSERLLASHPDWKDRQSQLNQRANEIGPSLQTANAENQIPNEMRDRYNDYHQFALRHLDAFIEDFLRKRARQTSSQQARKMLEDYMFRSYSTTGSRCLLHLVEE